MENHINQSPAIPKWSALLIEAVTKPGLIMKAYSAFHQYSVGNQILALVQCQFRGLQPGPINTFPKWTDLGRFVKRGERALTLCMPITCKRREDDSDEEHTFTSFVYKARWFVLSQTDGQELEPIAVPEWEADRALMALNIELAKILGHSNIKMTERYAKLAKHHIARTSNTAREMWKLLEPIGEKEAVG